jgi:hypothetical protein
MYTVLANIFGMKKNFLLTGQPSARLDAVHQD